MTIRFFIKLLYNECRLTLETCPNDTILQLKQKIANLENLSSIKPEDQELYCGEKLQNDRTVSDYNIRPGDDIRLVRKVAGVIQVFINNTVKVENRTRKSTFILIDPKRTVLELKEEYCKKTLYPVDHQRLLWGRYQLEDERTIASYGIPNDATIHLVARLRGGL
ncbi:hypothetical protein RclHR1_11180001 [Rhizophagus clarus]|uniref:Polyubiquitin-C n=1 Tax=Rhizophagus clarus TaxID=94130 RepID=A0A2Z6Q3P3_9GLOM|nr:hypothetical protein RclHR1_11180001 [Rhizophagus clarus]GES98291.1 polyubiquitin-C [Rhizophagus clarus]